jgi:hypothetical protein
LEVFSRKVDLKYILVAVLILFVGALGATFSGLDISNTNCEWTALTLEDSDQRFESFDELREEVGSERVSDLRDQADNSDTIGLRVHEPFFGEPVVQYKRCSISEG